MQCPMDRAGLVIGFKGSTIRLLSGKSKARISVTDTMVVQGASRRSVRIIGSKAQVGEEGKRERK